jgi:Nif-specific regulatory protein
VIGAFEVLNKRQGDFDYQDELSLLELADHAAAALENTQQLEQLLNTNRQLTGQAAASVQLVGRCAAIERLRSTIERVAKTDLTVLILGENGTGKEVVARKIHYQSDRHGAAFVAVNCAAVPDTLWESELFGHEQGAFTDAHQTQIGKFELAANGTLFLDEIAELSPAGQAKLLRVLEEKSIMRVGGSVPISTDVRVVVATNQNLIERVRQGSFREDLYFRVDVVSLQLPPLRDRGEDILLLFNQFLSRFAQKVGRKRPQLTAGGRKRLLAHSWPGNIRELRNLAERLVYLTIDEKIEAEALEFILAPHAAVEWIEDDLPLGEATIQFQRQYIARAIARSEENMSQAAARLGLHRSNLYRKLRQLEAGTSAQ